MQTIAIFPHLNKIHEILTKNIFFIDLSLLKQVN